MKTNGQHTYAEIMSQPAVWDAVISAFEASQAGILRGWGRLKPQAVLFIGCGSTHYLSLTAAALFQSLTGITARAYPSSELLLFPEQILLQPRRTLLVAISRSGTTTETLQAVNLYRARGGLAVWAITCYPNSDLAQTADLVLLAEAAQEQSVAQTRSFSSMLVLVQGLAATLGRLDLSTLRRLPEALSQFLEEAGEMAATLGRQLDLHNIFFLGSGYQYGIASEAMLKMKEMSLTSSEAYHFLEFRHGPMSMTNEQALVVGLVAEEARSHEEQVLEEMQALGAEVLGLNASSERCCRHRLGFGIKLPSWAMTTLYLPPLQLMAYERAMAKGLDPDNPRNLTAVVSLDPAVFVTG